MSEQIFNQMVRILVLFIPAIAAIFVITVVTPASDSSGALARFTPVLSVQPIMVPFGISLIIETDRGQLPRLPPHSSFLSTPQPPINPLPRQHIKLQY